MESEIALDQDTIVAVSTPHGTGGIAVIRLSGYQAIEIASKCWKGTDLSTVKSHSAHLGEILEEDGSVLDQVVATIFRAPNSFTGFDTVEISCHGSLWIQQHIVARLTDCGATPAPPGGFTKQAFLNGKLDLAQAEGVIDLINSTSRAAARLANTQLKGTFSSHLETLRNRLIDLGALLELELDFSEEDVEFANRSALIDLTDQINTTINRLAGSYRAGTAFKHGIPVTIAGIPNAGKSTLINNLLADDKAIVSDIPGTTRDIIEDTIEINGLLFRFFDTAGIRDTSDAIERIGVERARQKVSQASILLWLLDPTSPLSPQLSDPTLQQALNTPNLRTILLITKQDLKECNEDAKSFIESYPLPSSVNVLTISALTGKGIDDVLNLLTQLATEEYNPESEIIVTNARHYHALLSARESLTLLRQGLTAGLSADLLAQDLRAVLSHLGEITGAITSPDLLSTIFSRFCIGK